MSNFNDKTGSFCCRFSFVSVIDNRLRIVL